MTRIKLCGLTRPADIQAANALKPDYIGFVFAPKSRRYVRTETAAELRRLLDPGIEAVGVFVDEAPEAIAALLDSGIIQIAQLHGSESEEDIRALRSLTDKPIIKAFRVETERDVLTARASCADLVLLDSGAGTGTVFDWEVVSSVGRPYLLAGGLDPGNVGSAVGTLHPYGVDVSSGIETDGRKDENKMAAFVAAVRKEDHI